MAVDKAALLFPLGHSLCVNTCILKFMHLMVIAMKCHEARHVIGT